MASSLTLSTLRDRVEELLMDTGNAVFATGTIDAGIRLALEKLNTFRSVEKITTLTLGSETREVSLAGVTDLSDRNAIDNVWFPYESTDTQARPTWIEFDVFNVAGTLYLRLNCDNDPASGDVARVYYHALHTLNGLDSETVTTFDKRDEGIIAMGAAAYACVARGIDLNETAANMAVSTPNYAALYRVWMKEFLAAIEPRAAGVSAFPGYRVAC